MKNSVTLGLALALCCLLSCKDDKRYHDEHEIALSVIQDDPIREILKYQEDQNEKFRDPENSPLMAADRLNFKGLEFFEPDTNLRIEARLTRTPDALPFLMPTTTSRKARERVYGIARFTIGERDFELEVYQSLDVITREGYEDYLFLPFTDKTNGEETYSGGRYIDLRIPEGELLLIDFNRSYNPYCAYNKKYSCPIVPEVNHLDIPVLAGVKVFKKEKP